jgi:hypothetical protein
LLWAAFGDDPLRGTVGRHYPVLLNALQAFHQEVYPHGKGALLEPKQHHPDHQQGQKTIQGMDVQFAIRPVLHWPPQPRPPALAEAEHLLYPGLVPAGFHHTPRFKLLAVGKEDGLAKVAMF